MKLLFHLILELYNFAESDPAPLTSFSLPQAHAATTPGGQKVDVKVPIEEKTAVLLESTCLVFELLNYDNKVQILFQIYPDCCFPFTFLPRLDLQVFFSRMS
jgi:hypothetical protein